MSRSRCLSRLSVPDWHRKWRIPPHAFRTSFNNQLLENLLFKGSFLAKPRVNGHQPANNNTKNSDAHSTTKESSAERKMRFETDDFVVGVVVCPPFMAFMYMSSVKLSDRLKCYIAIQRGLGWVYGGVSWWNQSSLLTRASFCYSFWPKQLAPFLKI